MKDCKAALKEAREAIKNKNYEQSLKLCKQILKEDKENYTALVFLGVSYQETNQNQNAESAFKKAIKQNSSNPLAWNGLVNYYEKIDSPDAKAELIKSYIALFKIETNEKKLIEYSEKMCRLQEFGDISEIVTAIYALIQRETSGESMKTDLWVSVVDLLAKKKDLSQELIGIYDEGLNFVLNNKKTVRTEYYAEYLNLLYRQNKLEELFEHAKQMHSLFEIDSVSLKWVCKIFNEIYTESGKLVEQPDTIRQFYEKLLKLESQSPTALFTKSILLWLENKTFDSKELLTQVVESLPGLLHAWILLLKCCIKIGLFDEAVQAATKIDKLLKSASDSKKNKLRVDVDLLLIEALASSSEEEDLKRALTISDRIGDDLLRLKSLPHVIRANISLQNFPQVKLLLAELKNQPEFDFFYNLLSVQLLHKQGKYDAALDWLKREKFDESEWWIETGLVYWDAGQRDKSLIPFLKAAKLDSSNYKCFLYLAHYYRESRDFDKARRCYEKAFKINSRCAEAGIELSKIYRKLKNWDANLALLQSLTTGVINRKNSWAWMQLGLNYLEQEDCVSAINNLRYVIRVDGDNVHCWESLADAYLAKGAYTSALKCYEKASELSNASLYPLLQTANIKQILGEYTEARSNFQEVLSSNRTYVPALKGIAETCICQAKQCFRDQRLGACRDHIQFAADKLILAVQQRGDLTCLWKLLGDSCYFVTKLPEQYCCLSLPASFVEGQEVGGNKFFEKDQLYDLAARCFCKSLNLAEDNFFVWHDLSACYLSHAVDSKSADEFKVLIGRARAAAQHCTDKNPTNWQHWNLLANIAVHAAPPNYRFAQHCLIKAVVADNNSAVSWCNLGTIYLILGDFKLANEAFSQSQRSDPNYVNSWIGQALLAENFAHEDAMDLFRHSTQLGMHQQGAIGYAHWVCKTLKQAPMDEVIYSIHNMHAIPVACDALTWYTEKNAFDSSAWNMLGLLRERLGLKAGALQAFKKALALSGSKNRDLARVNYARLLEKHARCAEAVEMFSKVGEATFNGGSGLALALFKDGRYQESYEAYDSALHWLTDEENLQSDLLVALASMAYMFQGPDAAKTLLFQSIQLKTPSPWGFYATLSLGLLHNDLNLADLVYKEMSKLKDKKDCLGHISVLSAYLHILKDDPVKSVREISKIIHRHPDQSSPWLTLSSVLIRLQRQRPPSEAAAKCAQVAMKLGQTNMDVTKVLCLVSLSSFIVGDLKSARLSAQKAAHCYPNVAEAWAVLSAALLSTNLLVARDMLKRVEVLSSCKVLTEWTQRTLNLIS